MNFGDTFNVDNGISLGIPSGGFIKGWFRICSSVYLFNGSGTNILFIKSLAFSSSKKLGKLNY